MERRRDDCFTPIFQVHFHNDGGGHNEDETLQHWVGIQRCHNLIYNSKLITILL